MKQNKTAVVLIVALWVITLTMSFLAGTIACQKPNTIEIETENDYEEILPYTVEIPVSDAEALAARQENGITKEEAEKLCYKVLGDVADENGFPISYRCIGAVSANNKCYYVMHNTWLVDNNHWSYIGNCFVSYDGEEIYDGYVMPAKYEITRLRWEK